jgi:beta-N-acetylhexosaminidase
MESKKAGDLAKSLLQGQRDAGILSTIKHFPGYTGIPFNPEKKLATVQNLPDISSFILALGEQPEFLLTSNVIYTEFDPGTPFTFSQDGVSLIRSQFGFPGIILSDDLSQPSLMDNYSLETIATAPLKAGVTMVMFSREAYAEEAHGLLEDLIKTDTHLQASIQESAARIVELKKEFFGTPPPAKESEHFSQNK